MFTKVKYLCAVLVSFTGIAIASSAYAAAPVLTVTPSGTQGLAQINVSNADPNSMIVWYSRQGNDPVISISNYGQTNSSGTFNQNSILPVNNGSGASIEEYVVVNGQRSNSVFIYPNSFWTGNYNYNYSYNNNQNNNYNSCYTNSYNYNTNYCSGSVLFSQNNLNLNPGQNTTVTLSNSLGYSSTYYISSNFNSSIATASITGSTLYIYANQSGTGSITVCMNNAPANCGTLTITVNQQQYSGNLTFSQSNLALVGGQSSSAVTIYSPYGYYGSYYVSNNSNSSVVSTSISGNTLYVTGLYGTGSATLTVCQNSSPYNCGTVYVSVNNSNNYYNNNYNNSSISFSNLNPTLSINQAVNLTIFGANNNYSGYNYYISNNSNPNVVSAAVSGNVLSLRGLNYGSSSISVCQNNNYQCGTVNVVVGGTGSVLGASLYKNGTLISENGTVFQIYRNTKSAVFANAQSFLGLGYNFANVLNVGYTGLNNNAYLVSSPYMAHPWGTWIRSGNTIYFVHEQGLIPVGDYGTFLNNGGDDTLVVQANTYDFQKSLLSVMIYNDQRLR